MPTHTVKSLLGQPVIAQDSGKRVGSIQELLFHPAEHRVTAIILSKPPIAGATKVVTSAHISILGVDVTLIDSDASVISLADDPATQSASRPITKILRLQVLSTSGKRVGEVRDVTIDEKGSITGYELAQSVIRDAIRGKASVPVSSIFAVGSDAILINAEAAIAESEEEEETPAETNESLPCPEEGDQAEGDKPETPSA